MIERRGGRGMEALVFGALACIYLGLGQLYWQPVISLAKPDEALHLVFVADIRRGNLWPTAQFSPDPALNPFDLDQRCQPPLYYWLTALVTLPSDMPWPAAWASPNPSFLSGIPYANGARYISLKPLADSVAPARMWSLLLGCLTLAAVYRMARGWTDRAAAGLMALTAASLPSVLFAQSGVSNLALAAPLHAIALMILVIGVWRRGASPGRMTAFSILLICAVYTRVESLLLLLPAACCLLRDLRLGRFKARVYGGAAVVILAACAPLFARNLAVYGSLLASNCLTTRPVAIGLGDWFTREAAGYARAVFVTLGEGYIFAPEWVYFGLAVIVGIGLVGAIARPVFRREGAWALLVVHALGVVVSSIVGGLAYVAGGPRYIGSYGASWILLWIGGLIGLAPRAGRRYAIGAAYASLLVLHAVVLATVMWPVYAPRWVASSDVAGAPLAQFGEGILLRRAELAPIDSSGQRWRIRLWWQATRPPSDNFAVFVHASARAGQPPVAQIDSYAVRGNYPTSWWAVGGVFVDEHVLRLNAPPTLPLTITAGLYQPFRQMRLDAADSTGRRWRDDEVPIGAIP